MVRKLFLDVDDTLFDSENYVKRCLGGKWTSYSDSIYLALPSMTEKERMIVSQAHLDYSVIPYVNGARLGLELLLDRGYNITLCSCFWSAGEYAAKKEMASKLNLPIILCEGYDKSKVDMQGSIFIDDSPKMLNESSAEYKICFYRKSNYIEDLREGKFVYDWVDLIHLLVGSSAQAV